MMIRTLLFSVSFFLISPLQAFNCFFTLAKDNCWANYSVSITVTDVGTNKLLFTVNLPQGKMWARQSFTCQPSQKFQFTATYEPSIWQNDKDVVYSAMNFWALPEAPKKGEAAWEIPLCYARAFAEVPLPPQATGNCQCDFKSIPPVPLQ